MTQRLAYKHANHLKCLAWLDVVQEKLKCMLSLLHEVHTTTYKQSSVVELAASSEGGQRGYMCDIRDFFKMSRIWIKIGAAVVADVPLFQFLQRSSAAHAPQKQEATKCRHNASAISPEG